MLTPDASDMLCLRLLDDAIAYDTLTIYGVLHKALQFLARTRGICSGPGCTQVAHQADSLSDAHFLVCASCKIPRYCGKACQSADWTRRESQAPHKLVCPLLCKLLDAANVDMELAEFEAAAAVWTGTQPAYAISRCPR